MKITVERVSTIIDKLKDISQEDWNSNILADTLKTISKNLNCSMGDLYYPIRYLVCGVNIGAPVPDTLALLGKDVVISRLIKYKDL